MALTFAHFEGHSELLYGFSDRGEGSMHRHLEKENRKRFFQKKGIDPHHVVAVDSVHGGEVVVVSERDAGTLVPSVDALITNTKNLFLSATAADCFLVYFYDPSKEVVGIAHGGWRGVLAGVVGNTINALRVHFGVLPNNLLVGMAPGIRECHFEISSHDKNLFRRYSEYVSEKNGKVFVNLAGIITEQLRNAGVLREHVEDSGICTHCEEEKYFSSRRDKPKEIHVMIGYIGLGFVHEYRVQENSRSGLPEVAPKPWSGEHSPRECFSPKARP
ncbi:MAG: polyphenol oxidase family protein [bacterium]|nr:polyphenol oxidase family protein [bacterium]